MSFSAELSARAFAEVVARAASIAPPAAKIPIVGHALLAAEKDGVQVTATNLDQALTARVEGAGQGAVTAPAARLSAIAARLDPGGIVKLSATEAQLTVSQGRAIFRLPVLPAADFPSMLAEPLKKADPWEVPAATFSGALSALAGAVSPSEPRYYLAGAFLDMAPPENAAPAIVATDGNCLGAISLADHAPPARDGIILPHDCFRLIADLARGADGLALAIGDEAATVEAAAQGGFRRLRTKLVAGTYPAWRRVMPAPETRATRVTVETAAFSAMLARVGVVEGDPETKGKKRRAPSILLEIGEGEIAALSRNMEGEEASDACAAELTEGKPVAFRFVTRYLTWAIASLGGAERLEIGFGDAGAPVTVTAAGDTERTDLRVLMPMRV